MEQWLDLVCGSTSGAFETAAARREAWITNRGAIMADVGPLQRPQAFWDYEALKLGCEKDLAALKRLDLLTQGERVIVDDMERKTKRGQPNEPN